MLISEHLQQARNLLTPPGAWTQGALARNEKGENLFSVSQYAMCFCAVGAIRRIPWKLWSNFRGSDAAINMLTRVIPASAKQNMAVSLFNDAPERTQAEVLAAFDKAVALAKSEGK